MKRTIAWATVISLVVIPVIATMYAYDQSLAKNTDILIVQQQINSIEARMIQQQNLARARDVEKRLWLLDERYPNKDKMPISVKEEYLQLAIELAELRGK